MKLHMLLSKTIENSNEIWCSHLRAEIKGYEKGTLLTSHDVHEKMRGLLIFARNSLTHFGEKILGQSKGVIFDDEMAELNKIMDLQIIFNQRIEEEKKNKEVLDQAKKNLKTLNSRLDTKRLKKEVSS